MVDWEKTYGKNTSNVLVIRKEKKTHTEQHQEWEWESNNMLAAGFVENGLIWRNLPVCLQ